MKSKQREELTFTEGLVVGFFVFLLVSGSLILINNVLEERQKFQNMAEDYRNQTEFCQWAGFERPYGVTNPGKFGCAFYSTSGGSKLFSYRHVKQYCELKERVGSFCE